ncbi:MAG: hypothetical protein ABW252_08070 [Polyangiales bacterium]
MKRITANTIETIATKLRRMPAVKKPPEFSRQEALELLKSEITALQRRGYTIAQISKALRDEGLEVDAATVRGSLQPAPVPVPIKASERVVDKAPARAQKPTKKPAAPASKVKKAAAPRGGAASKSGVRRGMFELKPDTEDI